MEAAQKNELPEIETEMEGETKSRRSSILKPQKPRNPLSVLDFSEANPDNTLNKVTRRVSFASSNFVKPFAADPEKNTIWDTTYEEEVNHTDSTKSSCDQTHGTKTSEILNMSSIYSTSDVCRSEKMSTFTPYMDDASNTMNGKLQTLTQEVTNTQESLISFARKLRSQSVLEVNNKSEIMDFTLINGGNNYPETPEKQNIKLEENPSLVPSCSNTKNVNFSSTKVLSTTMEITTCIIDKENVHPLINDLSVVTHNSSKKNETKYFTEDLEFTQPLMVKEKTIYFGSSEDNLEFTKLDNKIDLGKSEMLFNKAPRDNVPDVAENNGVGSQKTIYFDDSVDSMELTSAYPKEPGEKSFVPAVAENKGINTQKMIYFDDSVDSMELTSACPKEVGEKSIVPAVAENKEIGTQKTIYFDDSVDSMELTSAFSKEPVEKSNVPVVAENRGIGTQKTIYFDDSVDLMELTSACPENPREKSNAPTTGENKGIGTQKTIYFEDSVDSMELTSACPKEPEEESKNPHSKHKTVIFNEAEDNMEFTVMNDSNLKSNTDLVQPTLNIGTRTKIFNQSENDMECTTTFPVEIISNIQLGNRRDPPQNCTAKPNETIHFQDSEGEMEFTTAFSKVIPRWKNINSSLKSCFSTNLQRNKEFGTLTSEIAVSNSIKSCDMELTATLPTKTIVQRDLELEKSVHQFGDNMELTSVLPANEGLNLSNMSLTRNLHVENEQTKTVIFGNKETDISQNTNKNYESVNSHLASKLEKTTESSDEDVKFKKNSNSRSSVNNTSVRQESSESVLKVATDSEPLKLFNIKFNHMNISSDNKEKRHSSEKMHDDMIKKRKIETKELVTVPTESIVSKCDAKLCVTSEKCMDTETNQNDINILYSEPLKIKLKSKEIPDLSLNLHSLSGTLNFDRVTTPATSFRFSLSTMSPCTEDTQQLIHATFSNPESCGKVNKGEETSLKIEDKCNNRMDVENNSYNVVQKCKKPSENRELEKTYNISRESISHGTNVNEKTYIKGTGFPQVNILSESSDNDFIKISQESFHKGKSFFLEDITPLALVPEEFDDFLENKSPIQNNIHMNSNSPEHKEPPENISSPDINNYTLRSQYVLNNIEKCLTPYEPETFQSKFSMAKLSKQFKENCTIIRDLLHNLKKRVMVEDLEEIHKRDITESLSGVTEADIVAKKDPPPSTVGLIAPKSLQEKILEMAKGTNNYWKFVKAENDYYYFQTLFGTLSFNVHIHPELGTVYSVETSINLSEIAEPLCWYEVKVLRQKLSQNNLACVLGTDYDIFALLDYIYMSTEEIINFHTEFLQLKKKYGYSHHFRMNPDHSIVFEILSVKLILFWIITLKMPETNLFAITKEDVSATDKLSQKVNEEHIKSIVDNTPKGPNFLRNFIENVDDYVNRFSRRIKK